jgi:aminoglycoside phosphotransferase (APT) family kinase protein
MRPDQVEIAPETARTLIAAQFPHFVGEPVTRLATPGTVNAIFRIGRRAAARFPLQREDPDVLFARLEADAAAMRAFAQLCPVATPHPIGIGKPGFGYPLPFAVQSWVPGAPLTPTSHESSDRLADDIAGLIATLRTADTGGRAFSGKGRGGRLDVHHAWVSRCLIESRDLLNTAALEGMWHRLSQLEPPSRLAMSHTDLTPFNLLCDGERLCGVLDAGDYGPADPALDLVAAWHLFDADRRARIRQHLGSSDAEWCRGAAWALQQALGLVWYYLNTNPPMADLGRSTIARLLAAEELRP